MKTKWYSSIRTRTILFLTLFIGAGFGISYFLIQDYQVNSKVNSRINEINRYAVLVASDISMSRYVNQSSSGEYEEVDTMAVF